MISDKRHDTLMTLDCTRGL